MSFKTIRHAQQKAWPRVLESLDYHRRNREAVKADPHGATTAARTRANRSWNRVVADETVWALAKADLLVSEEQQAVVAAARAWVKSWKDTGPPSLDDGDTSEDVALYAAVQELVSVLDIPDESLDI